MGEHEVCDDRDGRAYRSVRVGAQVWLGEYLKFTKGLQLDFDPVREEYENFIHCVDNDSLNCVNEKVLYDGALLSQDGKWQDFCPEGYRISSLEDWKELFLTMGLSTNNDSIADKGSYRVSN
ncbi:hypothetical protein OAA91_00640 [Fibrobacterales bacterium]|nr:hypothetical protein [Fibrobacterales bacterium]